MFKPVNRYIHVEIADAEPSERDSGIVLPADYNPTLSTHVAARVKDWAADVRFARQLQKESEIIVDRSMLEEITLNKEKITVVLDNYVIAIIS